jgi:hypothetical protein
VGFVVVNMTLGQGLVFSECFCFPLSLSSLLLHIHFYFSGVLDKGLVSSVVLWRHNLTPFQEYQHTVCLSNLSVSRDVSVFAARICPPKC